MTNQITREKLLFPDELTAFHRFCDCCEDSEAGGHDVPQPMMQRLAATGLVRHFGRGYYKTTRFGDSVRSPEFFSAELSDQAGAPAGSREAFETWLASDSRYAKCHNSAWVAWQAALASKAVAQPVDVSEAFSQFVIDHLGLNALTGEKISIYDAAEKAFHAGALLSPAVQVPEPKWIVNDLGELGVQVDGRCFFLYKGESLEYESGLHDDDSPMLYRIVGKREFGETQFPQKWITAGRSEDRYTEKLLYIEGLSFGKPEDGDWMPLPAASQPKAK